MSTDSEKELKKFRLVIAKPQLRLNLQMILSFSLNRPRPRVQEDSLATLEE